MTRARVLVDGKPFSEIDIGAVLLVALEEGDDGDTVSRAADKIAALRYFSDEQGRMNLDLGAVGGALLVISQFTLAASTAKGRRPSFESAMKPDRAQPLFDSFIETLRQLDLDVATGSFGANMQVELTNDGPVTLALDF